MNTNRLSDSITAALNAQMTKEAHAAQIYLAYGCWANAEGYEGIANFLFRHSQEERNHMTKVMEYILKRGARVKVESIPKPGADPDSVQDCFEKIFNQEVENSAAIYRVVKL